MTERREGEQGGIGVKDSFRAKNLPGGRSAVVPPDPMPNSEVKRRSADGSVGSPHARVGNCQASYKAKTPTRRPGFFACGLNKKSGCPLRGLTFSSEELSGGCAAMRQ